MATVSNVEEVLRWGVRERLEEVSAAYDTLEVTFHLALDHRLAYDVTPSDEDPDVQVGQLTQTPIWMLNLTFSDGDTFTVFNGTVPYQCCAAGQTKPLTDMVNALWERYVLARSLHDAGLDGVDETTLGDETDETG